MLATELISDTIPSVKSTDIVARVLDWMGEFKVTKLPIVVKQKFWGIVRESELLDALDDEMTIGELLEIDENELSEEGKKYGILDSKHFYEVLAQMGKFQLEILPVIDEDRNYLGMITAADIAFHAGELFAVHEEGSIIVVETLQNNYMLTEVARIVEAANAKVLSLYIQNFPDSAKVWITLKINVLNPEKVISLFERYNYTFISAYQPEEDNNDYKRNLSALMRMID